MDRRRACYVCKTETAEEYVQYWNMGLWMTYCRTCDEKINVIRPHKRNCEILNKI